MAEPTRKSHKRKIDGAGSLDNSATAIDSRSAGTDSQPGSDSRTADTGAGNPPLVRVPDESAPSAEVVPPERGRQRVYKERARAKAETAKASVTAQQTSDMLISIVETFGIAFFGEVGRMKEAPRLLISQSLPKVLEAATPEVTRQVEGYLYPGMLAVGVGAYALDVWRSVSMIKIAEQEARARESAVSVPAPIAPSNGAAPAPSVPDLVIASGGVDDLASHDGRDFISPRAVL